MEYINFREAVWEEYCDSANYMEQATNILFGLFRVCAAWLILTVVYTAAMTAIWFLSEGFNELSQSEIQARLEILITISAGVAGIVCLVGNVGKFRDVFRFRAHEKIKLFADAKEEEKRRIDTTESLMVKHGLITEEDVKRRRAGISANAPQAKRAG